MPNLREDYEQYKELFLSVEAAMVGHKDDHLIPVLTTLLGIVAVESNTPKRKLLAYVADTLDTIYSNPEYFK